MPNGDSELWRAVEHERAERDRKKQEDYANRLAWDRAVPSLTAQLTHASNEFYARIISTDFYRAALRGFDPQGAVGRYFKQDVLENSGWWLSSTVWVSYGDHGHLNAVLYITIKGRAYPNGHHYHWQKSEEAAIDDACRKVVEWLVSRFDSPYRSFQEDAPKIEGMISSLIEEMGKSLAAAIDWRQLLQHST